MKPIVNTHRKEVGQSIILIVVAMMGMIVLLTLVLDGGTAMLYRRIAQVAADAGAYSGARALCLGESSSDVNKAVVEYALTQNEADKVDVLINGLVVTVTTYKEFGTFFAPLIGVPSITVEAVAEATCFPPGYATGVLPVAWACADDELGESDSDDCLMDWITDEELTSFKSDPNSDEAIKHTYVIMDSIPTGENFCQPEGSVDCDLDGDGVDDILGNGARSWLDLDGGNGGAKELSDWITDGFDGTLNIHTWLPDQSGEITSVFLAAQTRVGDIVILPVFDGVSTGNPATNGYLDIFHPDPAVAKGDVVVTVKAVKALYYHIKAFAGFYISCVQAGKDSGCMASVDQGGPLTVDKKWIEGYFVNGYVPGIGGKPGDGIDTGIFTVYLIK